MKNVQKYDSFPRRLEQPAFFGIMRKFFSRFFPDRRDVASTPLLFFFGQEWVCPLSSPGHITLSMARKDSFYLGLPTQQIQEEIFDNAQVMLPTERERILQTLSMLKEKDCLHLASEEYLKLAMMFLIENNMRAALESVENAVVWGKHPSLPTENLHRMADLAILKYFCEKSESECSDTFAECAEKSMKEKMPSGISAFPHLYNLVTYRLQRNFPPDALFHQAIEKLEVVHRDQLHTNLPFRATVGDVLTQAKHVSLSSQKRCSL